MQKQPLHDFKLFFLRERDLIKASAIEGKMLLKREVITTAGKYFMTWHVDLTY